MTDETDIKKEPLEDVTFEEKKQKKEGPPSKAHETFLETVSDVPVRVTAHLGTAQMPIGELAKLGRGAVVPLNKRVGEPIDIQVNNCIVARGEVVLVGDNIGITITELLKTESLT